MTYFVSEQSEVRMYETPDLVQRVTVTGWVDRAGHFWGDDEHMARFCSATHKRCACGSVMRINTTMCDACIEARDTEKYNALPRVPWDGVGMIYSDKLREFFADIESACDAADCRGTTIEYLRLMACEPMYLHTIDADTWSDDLPDDEDPKYALPIEVSTALDALNEAIKRAGPVSWWPGDSAIVLPETRP